MLSSLLLSSCANTPDNIKDSSKQSGENSYQTVASKIQTSKLVSCENDFCSKIKQQKYDNLTISDNFTLNSVSEVGVYDVGFADEFEKNAQMLFEHYVPQNQFDSSKIVSSEDSVSSRRFSQYDTDDSFTLITSVGGFTFSDKICLNRIFYGTEIDFTSTYTFENCNLEENLTIGDKEVTLNDMLQNSENCIDKFTKLVDYPNEIKPFSVSTQQLEDGTVVANIHCRSYYKELPVFDIVSKNSEYSFKKADLMGPICTVADGSNIGQFTVGQTYTDYKTEQQLTEIISPVWAMNAVSEKLSGYSDYDVTSEELVYMPECIGSTIGSKSGNGTYQDDIIRLTPYWVIYFDLNWWRESFAVVNAVTGDVDYINNSK